MDSTIIQSIIIGDKQSFKHFYNEYFDKSLYTAISITKNKDLAKEAVQETFIRVFRNLYKFDTTKPFNPWFYRILTNECNRIMKKEGKVIFIDRDKMENDEKLSEQKDEAAEDLHEAIQNLDDMYRIPLVLKYLNGFSEAEIADTLDLNLNTVKTRLFKAREKLKISFERFTDRGSENV